MLNKIDRIAIEIKIAILLTGMMCAIVSCYAFWPCDMVPHPHIPCEEAPEMEEACVKNA